MSDGGMADEIRNFNWANTPLGDMAGWPTSLRTLVETMLSSRFPKALVWGPDLTTLHNDAFRIILGEKPSAIGQSFRDVWAESWHDIAPIMERALEGHSTFIEDFHLVIKRDKNPEDAFFTFCYSPVRDETGAVAGVLDTVIETTKTVLGTRAAAAAHARLAEREAFLFSVLKASTDCIKVLDTEGNLAFMSAGGMAVMEVPDFSAVSGCYWPGFLDGSSKDLATDALAAARRGETTHFEMSANTFGGVSKWWNVSVSPIFSNDGEVSQILAVSRDHTSLKAARERQEFLQAELNHRMKNQLAVVQAIVSQTLRSATDMAVVAATLKSRIQVLAKAQDLVFAGIDGRTTVNEIVQQNMLVHDNGLASQFDVNGPDIPVGSRPATSLALILHELSTNATKYGALSVPTGKVSVTWRIDTTGDQSMFVLDWAEKGGPSVAQPRRASAGSQLISAGLSGAINSSVTTNYEVTGLTCRIATDLESFRNNE